MDALAEFIGNLKQFLAEELRYPQYEVENEKGGKVYSSFIVTETGSIECAILLMGVSDTVNEEALRVVRKFPPFKPVQKNGENVRSIYNFPIVFKLN